MRELSTAPAFIGRDSFLRVTRVASKRISNKQSSKPQAHAIKQQAKQAKQAYRDFEAEMWDLMTPSPGLCLHRKG